MRSCVEVVDTPTVNTTCTHVCDRNGPVFFCPGCSVVTSVYTLLPVNESWPVRKPNHRWPSFMIPA